MGFQALIGKNFVTWTDWSSSADYNQLPGWTPIISLDNLVSISEACEIHNAKPSIGLTRQSVKLKKKIVEKALAHIMHIYAA